MTGDSLTLKETVEGWWVSQRLSQGGRSERKSLEAGEPARAAQAVDHVHERMEAGGTDALVLVWALVAAAVTDDDLALVGAGPLEELLVAHGAALADAIAQLARREPRFAATLRTVWWSPPDRAAADRLGRWLPDRVNDRPSA